MLAVRKKVQPAQKRDGILEFVVQIYIYHQYFNVQGLFATELQLSKKHSQFITSIFCAVIFKIKNISTVLCLYFCAVFFKHK